MKLEHWISPVLGSIPGVMPGKTRPKGWQPNVVGLDCRQQSARMQYWMSESLTRSEYAHPNTDSVRACKRYLQVVVKDLKNICQTNRLRIDVQQTENYNSRPMDNIHIVHRTTLLDRELYEKRSQAPRSAAAQSAALQSTTNPPIMIRRSVGEDCGANFSRRRSSLESRAHEEDCQIRGTRLGDSWITHGSTAVVRRGSVDLSDFGVESRYDRANSREAELRKNDARLFRTQPLVLSRRGSAGV